MMKKLKLLRCPSFWFDPTPKIKNSKISGSFLLLQSLILVVTQDLKHKKSTETKTKRSPYGLRRKINISEISELFFFPIPKIESLEISEICLLLHILTVVMNQDLKTTRIWTEQKTERFQYDLKEKKKISEISEFWILALYPRSKTRKSWKFRLARILTMIVIQDLKTPINELRQKLKGSDMI